MPGCCLPRVVCSDACRVVSPLVRVPIRPAAGGWQGANVPVSIPAEMLPAALVTEAPEPCIANTALWQHQQQQWQHERSVMLLRGCMTPQPDLTTELACPE